MSRTALYRHFDAAGALLYVGISNDALRRLCQHKDRSHWQAEIRRVEVQWLPDRPSALAAEEAAIATEGPAWNLKGRSSKVARTPPTRQKSDEAIPPPAGAHPLIGMFFHTYTDAGERQYQAHVLSVDGEFVLAQMFSWFFGEPTNVQAFEKALIYSDRCKLYPTREAWLHAAETEKRIGRRGVA